MARVLLAITGTVVGLVVLLGFKSHPLTAGSPGSLLPAASLPAPGSGAPRTGGSSRAPKSADAGSSDGAAPASRSITGQEVQTRYGVVQVRISVSGTRILDVGFVQLTADDQRSQEINSQAGPVLLQQTLSAQSSRIDGVSGATYTSEGYMGSLQSALDVAGIS